jgi:hypothetical protein
MDAIGASEGTNKLNLKFESSKLKDLAKFVKLQFRTLDKKKLKIPIKLYHL